MSSTVNVTLVDDLCVLKIAGEDASRFLQGQLTNDVNTIDQSAITAAYCLPNGRVLSVMRLIKTADAIYAIVNAENADSLVKRLKLYVLRSQVTVEKDASLAVYFTKISPLSAIGSVESVGENTYFLYLDAPDKATADSSHFWSAATENGDAWVGEKTQGLFTPYALNLDLKGGVSFTKGCYTGQEIIGRMHYHDKINRRAHRYATEKKLEGATDLTDSQGRATARVIQSSETEALVECEEKALQKVLFYGETKLTLIS